ncbi:MAG TPA: ATP-binding protein, partial [Ilumatobacteraceae bacterium]
MTTTAPLPVDDGTTPVHDTPEVEAEESAWRYKGSAPFGDDELDRRLFCGRKNEITTVIHSILSHDLLLVYAVSGMGKTSLLSAGVFEPLRERGYWPIIVRLNDPSKRIVELIDERLRSADAADDEIEITRNPSLPPLDVATATLWDLLAGLEVWKGNSLQRPVLVFDQFEELFTLPWDEHDRAQFIVSFGEVIRRHRSEPQSLTDFDRTTAADTERAVDAGAAPPVAPPPPNIKVVLVMREDSLGELERLAADVPQILQHRFRLEGLDPEQAMAAITEPAQVSDPNLKSHTFKYQDEAAATILEFLRSRQERGRTVTSRFAEPPQLQIICEHVERTILPGKRPSDEPDAVVEITDADLGGRDGLQRILRDFYRTKLQMFARKDRRRVRELCETGLITPSHRRLSLEQESIEQQFHVSKATLDKLVEHRVLRVETRLDSSYYELAHDTMVPPILA